MPRDSAGNYTLPAGNPVASGEIISANWANTTMEDLGDALSASLDRYGRGGMLAPFAFADGTSSAPGATWSNEPTTGLYRNAYADLRMTVTGQDNQRWTATSSFLWRNSQWQEIVTIGTNTGTLTVDDLVVNNSLTVDTDTLVVDPTNNRVGIGTSGPTTPLHVELSSSSFRVAPLTDTTQVDTFYGSVYKRLQFRSSEYGYKLADGSEAMTIISSGNVGIGTSAPVAPLHVKPATDVNFGVDDSGSDLLLFSFNDLNQTAAVPMNLQANSFKFSGSSDFVSITSTGNVGIGTNNPGTELTVAAANPTIRMQSSGAGTNTILSYVSRNISNVAAYANIIADGEAHNSTNAPLRFTQGPAATERMRIDSSGNLLVGKTSLVDTTVGGQIEPNGRISSTMASATNSISSFNLYSTGAGAYRFYVSLDGQVRAAQTSILGISDASLKENVRDLDKGLDTIMALQPRRFDWKNGDGSDVMGFIAQEVEDVMPELVADYQYNDDEVKKGLKMGDMIPAMVKAMQEQQALIQDLKAEVEALKG